MNLQAWIHSFPANTFARFGDGNRVEEILAKHFQHIVWPNFTAGFIQSKWEIDGNLGIMAAIGEMLLQSHELRGGSFHCAGAGCTRCATCGPMWSGGGGDPWQTGLYTRPADCPAWRPAVMLASPWQ